MFKKYFRFIFIILYLFLIAVSFFFEIEMGIQIGKNFYQFFINMMKLIPCIFILIGLFEVWVKRETVERHLGEEGGFFSYVWAVLLAGTTIGGLFVAFPVAAALSKKGARLSVIFSYIGAAGICRIPMTVFEATFVGLEFTLIRLSVSLPLVIFSSILLGNYLTKRQYQIKMKD